MSLLVRGRVDPRGATLGSSPFASGREEGKGVSPTPPLESTE